jgi:hypothetical protein
MRSSAATVHGTSVDMSPEVCIQEDRDAHLHTDVRAVRLCGRFGGKDYNSRASYLYGIQIHGQPIVGDAILIGTTFDPMEGEDWADLPEHVTLESIAQYVLHDDASGLLG